MSKMNSEIPRSKLKPYIIHRLWAISAGRCQICNKKLYIDSALGMSGNFAENAHIHAVSVNGPRHKNTLNEDELNSCDNLMLLCAEHHHLIDTNPIEYTDGILLQYKKTHELKIETAAEISNYQTSRIVSYFSNIDSQTILHDETLFKQALRMNNTFPMQFPVIKLHKDSGVKYVSTSEEICRQAVELENNFKAYFTDIVETSQSISVFALAPQPLLIKLGTLLNDQYNTCVFQCHRAGHKWAWKENNCMPNYIVKRTCEKSDTNVALVIDLSAEVTDDRIIDVLGGDISIFHLTVSIPNRNFVDNLNVQNEFVKHFRKLMETIKNTTNATEIHLFPVMPNSLAVKLGMDLMPKADLPIIIYEQSNFKDGFFKTITIGG